MSLWSATFASEQFAEPSRGFYPILSFPVTLLLTRLRGFACG